MEFENILRIINNVVKEIGRSILIYLIFIGVLTNIIVAPKILSNGEITIDPETVWIKAGEKAVKDERTTK